jgi:nicotinamidase-related amidase
MDPKHTAVVLIEYQNDFTSEGGTLHDAVKPVMRARAIPRRPGSGSEPCRCRSMI